MTDDLETQIRQALGRYNDKQLPIVTVIKRFVAAHDLRLEQLLICKPDAERHRKMLRLGNQWLAQARARAAESENAPSIDEQLDQLLTGKDSDLSLPTEPGVGYRMPYHPTQHQVIEICATLRPDFAHMSTPHRSRLDSKVRQMWRAIAEQINEPPAALPMAAGE